MSRKQEIARSIPLTPTSFIVLGFFSAFGEGTPYDLKRMVALAVGHFWSVPHSQLYAEPDRLAAAGYLTMRQEPSGRRRKLYLITEPGEAALAGWRAAPTLEGHEIRDPATLKLFFGADPSALAEAKLQVLAAQLQTFEQAMERANEAYPDARLALEYALHMLHASLEFWQRLAERD